MRLLIYMLSLFCIILFLSLSLFIFISSRGQMRDVFFFFFAAMPLIYLHFMIYAFFMPLMPPDVFFFFFFFLSVFIALRHAIFYFSSRSLMLRRQAFLSQLSFAMRYDAFFFALPLVFFWLICAPLLLRALYVLWRRHERFLSRRLMPRHFYASGGVMIAAPLEFSSLRRRLFHFR